MLESGVDGMKGIKVKGLENPLVKFLMKNDDRKYFWIVEMWPSPVRRWNLPQDTCSMFWTLMGHSALVVRNFLTACVVAFLPIYSVYSMTFALVVWLHFGLNPMKVEGDIAVATGVAWFMVIIASARAFGGHYLFKRMEKYVENTIMKAGEPTTRLVKMTGGVELAKILIKSIKEKTCFKIDYEWNHDERD